MRLLLMIFLTSFTLSADDHEQPTFEGLLSSEVFNLDGGMELYVENVQLVLLVLHLNIFILQLVH